MKKIILPLLFCLSLISNRSNAQVPNGNFENLLSDGSLSNWGNITLWVVIIDSAGNEVIDSIGIDGPFCSATTDAYSGNYALEMRNAYDYTANHGISGWASVDEDTVYSAWGSLEFIYSPIQPQDFNFYYKYNSVNGDSGIARLTFYDSLMDQIGEGIMIFTGTNTTYTYASVPITYNSPNPVYAYSLHFNTYYSLADYPSGSNFGTRLLIDDITLTGTTGIADFNSSDEVVVYPNPCTEFLSVSGKESVSEYSIYNMNGKLIQTGRLSHDSKVYLGQNLPAGVYSIELKDNDFLERKNFIVK